MRQTKILGAGWGVRLAAWAMILGPAWVGCAHDPKVTSKSRFSAAEDRCAAAEEAVERAEDLIATFAVDEAEAELDRAASILSDPSVRAFPDHVMLTVRVSEGRKALLAAREEMAKPSVEERIAAQRNALEEVLQRLKIQTQSLADEGATASSMITARELIDKLRGMVHDAAELESEDAGYARYADLLRRILDRAAETVDNAEMVIAFRDGPTKARRKGLELAHLAKQERSRTEKVTLYADAVEQMSICAQRGRDMLRDAPELASRSITSVGTPVSASELISNCSSDARKLKKKLRKAKKRARQKRRHR